MPQILQITSVLLVALTLGCSDSRNGDLDIFWKAKKAVIEGDVRLIKQQLATNPDLKTTRDPWDKATLLHHAAINTQHLEMVDALLNVGLDVNALNDLGQTALHLAYMFSAETNVIDRLLKAGANPEVRDSYGKRPSDYAEKSR